MRILKLHIGLVKYLLTELKRKRTLKELILFFKNVMVSYTKEMIKLYKDLFLVFDIDYQKQKKQYDNYQKVKKELNQALKILQYVDDRMEKQGLSRQRRRQFWQDFYKYGSVRKEMFDDLVRELGGKK
jgi:hypothetical protein